MKRVIALVAVAVVTIPAAAPSAAAREAGPPKKQPEVLGFFQGRTVKYFDFGPIKLKAGNKVAPIWTFTNGADGQRNIIDTVPGRADYSPLWRVNEVTWASGATPRVLRSAQDVRRAVAAGEATVERTKTVVNCPVLGFGQVRHPGFSRGKTIRYYELGEVKVAAGNEVVPLWSFTNGAKGQRNVADVRPGQTAYPPLWAIVEVTWRRGAKPRVLKSFAQIRRARSARQLTLRKTSAVVNCPLV
ncbi:MAG TPA: hypothetical protein VI122_06910 [Thermoleophilaceae bacterium]